MLVLDTDLITLLQWQASAAFRRLKQRLDAVATTEPIRVTIVSFEEQTRGWLAQIAKARESQHQVSAYRRLHELHEDYCRRIVLDYDQAAVEQFGRLRKAKLRIGTMDLKIAAIALAHDATLLSRNLADYRKVPALRVEDWTAA